MPSRRSLSLHLIVAFLLASGGARAASKETAAPAPSPEDWSRRLAGMERRSGLLDLYLERDEGKIWLELPAPGGADGEVGSFLYVEGLKTGLGSNPVGLDRGELGESRVVELRRLGNRVLFEETNLRYRAPSGDAEERRAARESFATSVLWAGEIAHTRSDGRLIVDLTPFLLRDAHGVAARLASTGQGKFSLDRERSAVDLEACLAFPDNLELQAVLTWSGEEAGDLVRETAPTPESITLVQHHSLVRLPEPGYRPRAFDPRAGSFAIGFADYSASLEEPIERRWIVRFRLEKSDPSAPSAPAVRPVVFYVDRGIPEPVRSAVIEGASWWAEAFEAAGFQDGYRVELLPEGIHPMDIRYNVIEWVHRSTRGWSYGGGVTDPRTGEQIKGHVRLGSLRVRQDRLLFEGLAGTGRTGSGDPDDPVQLALARIRQLAAHEVGHTLGLTHNFAASTYGGRASVMDYPAPLVRLRPDGTLDFSAAYGVGLGEWDLHAIRFAYFQPPPGADQAEALAEIVRDGLDRDLLFLTDADARPEGAAHPLANLWDNGEDPVAALSGALAVRRVALERFGEDNVLPGTPLALLEEVLAPVYFHHRYQLQAAVKSLGGVEYGYALRGDGQPGPRPVGAERQRRALEAVLDTLAPEELDLPTGVLEVIPPRPFGYRPHRELIGGYMAPVFDPLGAAATAARLAIRGLLQPERAARLVEHHRRDGKLPGLEEVLETVGDRVFTAPPDEAERHAEIRRLVAEVLVRELIRLASDPEASPAVRFRVEDELGRLRVRLDPAAGASTTATAHRRFLADLIGRHLERVRAEGESPMVAAPAAPPGDPIGMPEAWIGLAGCASEPW